VLTGHARVLIAANAINGVKALMGSAYLGSIIRDYNGEIAVEHTGRQEPAAVFFIDVIPRYWFNAQLNYPSFMVPGILVILVTMVGAYLCALNIVKEKEIGTIEQVNVSPIRRHHFILGKLIPFWVIGMVVFSIGLFGVARGVYGIVPSGSLPALYAFLALYLVALLGIGLLISTYSGNQQQAMSIAFFCMMIFILMGGLFTPVESMPGWAQQIAYLNPVTYFIQVVRMVVLKGSGFADIVHQFAVIGFMAVFFNTWAILNYRKTN
jgi:ABC-2 type transport system permease protein